MAAYKQSFFPRTIQEWNRLPIAVTNATKLEEFKASLLSKMVLQQQNKSWCETSSSSSSDMRSVVGDDCKT
jgi:hypothetical protein